MRRELYETIRQALLGRLKTVEGADVVVAAEHADLYADEESTIKHVDLWNRNVEFIDEEQPWERPAVFVELPPLRWERIVGGSYRTQGTVRLHVVTDWVSGGLPLDLCEQVAEAVCDVRGVSFGPLSLQESVTNHDHEEIVESIESFAFTGVMKN